MNDELTKLIELFCEQGGKFENMEIGHKEESGYFCSVIDNQHKATVFCPAKLLVDIDDIGITKSGLYISKPENYADGISFLNMYFKFHYDENLIAKVLEEKQKIDDLSNDEKATLKIVGLPITLENIDPTNELEYAKRIICSSHNIRIASGKKAIMPVVTFLNHDHNGIPYNVDKNGITVSGKSDGEMFAYYSDNDLLMFLGEYGFITDTLFIYSLPMHIKFPNGVELQIKQDISNLKMSKDRASWPDIVKKDGIFIVSWFPMYSKKSPGLPPATAAFVANKINVPPQNIIYSIFRYNFKNLSRVVFSLKNSENKYAQKVVSGIERQLELILGETLNTNKPN